MVEESTRTHSHRQQASGACTKGVCLRRWSGLTVVVSLALAACASNMPAVDDNEQFVSSNTYSHSFAGTGTNTCEAARRALLSQGYIITEAKPTLTKGVKNFQRDRNTHAEIEFNVVCVPDNEGSNSTTVFVNAVRQTYSLKKSSNSASVGVGVLGSLSVPFGSSDDEMVRIGAETIVSAAFYKQFFTRVESYVDASNVETIGGADDEDRD